MGRMHPAEAGPRMTPNERQYLKAQNIADGIGTGSTWMHALVGETVRDRARHLCYACLHYMDGIGYTFDRINRHQVISIVSEHELSLDKINLMTLMSRTLG